MSPHPAPPAKPLTCPRPAHDDFPLEQDGWYSCWAPGQATEQRVEGWKATAGRVRKPGRRWASGWATAVGAAEHSDGYRAGRGGGQARLPTGHPAGSGVPRQPRPRGPPGPGLTASAHLPGNFGGQRHVRVTDDDGTVPLARQAPGARRAQGPRSDRQVEARAATVRAGGSGRRARRATRLGSRPAGGRRCVGHRVHARV